MPCAIRRSNPVVADQDHADPNRQDEAILDLACAIEVFQTGALVHDDIIDESDLRRGRPSAHKALQEVAHSAAIGKGLGLMLGDMLATCSIDIASQCGRTLPNAVPILHAFLNMQRDVEVGQVLDLAVELTPLDDPARLAEASLRVFRWKTASYTTIAPILLAFLASGMDPDSADRYAQSVGIPVGIAFQLADDLIDVIGTSDTTGKPVGGDIREGKRTVLLADALRLASPTDRDALMDMFLSPSRGDAQVAAAMAIFTRSGAIEASRHRITRLWQEAERAVDDLPLGADGKEIIRRACAAFIARIG